MLGGSCRGDGIEISAGRGPRKGTGALLALLLAVLGAGALPAQALPRCEGRTALVLSGGGAKGVAHLGVFQALDSLGLRPDLIVGTSMGAIMGGLYASGYSAAGVDSLVRMGPSGLFASRPPRSPRAWRPMIPVLRWEQGARGLTLQSPTAQESGTNAATNAMFLRGNLLAQGDFNRLPIPFRAVATDLTSGQPVVLGTGDLAQAIRASIAIPLLFNPVPIDGVPLTDGGMSANVPIAVARALGADRVIVSDVSGRLLTAEELADPLRVADQLVAFLFAQPRDSLGAADRHVRVDVEGIGTLDFSAATLDTLRARGRRAADSVLATLSCRPLHPAVGSAAAMRHGAFRVEGASSADAEVLQRLLRVTPGAPVDEEALGARLLALRDIEAYRAIWLHPTAEPDGRVRFDVEAVPAPRRRGGATFSYDHTLSGRLGGAWLDRSLFGSAAEWWALGGFGPIKADVTLGIRRYLGVGRSRFAPFATAHGATERVIRYADGDEVHRPRTRDALAFVGLERELGAHGVLQLGFEGRLWRVDADAVRLPAGRSGSSGGFGVRVSYDPDGTVVTGSLSWSGTVRLASAEVSRAFTTGRLTVTPRARLGWGEHLPLGLTFPLGGDDGFPGLATHELRGDREMMAALQAAWLVSGPLSVRAQLAAGRSADGGALLGGNDGARDLVGLRAGVGVDTPLGPAQVEYGVATGGRSSLFLRVGRWF